MTIMDLSRRSFISALVAATAAPKLFFKRTTESKQIVKKKGIYLSKEAIEDIKAWQ